MAHPMALRTKLRLLGLAAALVPLLVLLVVVFLTYESEDERLLPDGSVESTRVASTNVPAEVFVATAILSGAAIVAVFVWSSRAVAPMKEVTSLADQIQAGSLDRRLDFDQQPEEVQALADSFDRMLDRLAEASSAQQRLIEDVSHELRTPLAALRGWNELISADRAATVDDLRAYLAKCEALVSRMETTVEELLNDARARNHGRRQTDNDVAAIVRRVADHQQAVTPQTRIEVRGADGAVLVGIHGPSVERALANLVANAVRYSPDGESVHVDLELGPPVRVHVEDRGPGIAATDRESIFERYERDEQRGGHGIGLALVRQVAEAHGAVDVTSPVDAAGRGARFTLTLERMPAG